MLIVEKPMQGSAYLLEAPSWKLILSQSYVDMLSKWGWKHEAQQLNFPAYRTLYIPQLLETNLLSETTVSQVQLAFICLNAAIMTI